MPNHAVLLASSQLLKQSIKERSPVSVPLLLSGAVISVANHCLYKPNLVSKLRLRLSAFRKTIVMMYNITVRGEVTVSVIVKNFEKHSHVGVGDQLTIRVEVITDSEEALRGLTVTSWQP
jgi:hypothetical protein